MKAALVLQWRGVVPGREQQSLEFARESEEFWSKRAEEGKCSKPTWFISLDASGIWFVTGEVGDLMEIEMSEAGQKMSAKATMLLNDAHLGIYLAGDAVAQQMANFQAATNELGLAATRS